MTQPITIPICRDPDYLPGDRMKLEVDSSLQPDRIQVHPHTREQQGFGHGHPHQVLFGRIVLTPDRVPFGAGEFGVGCSQLDHETVTRYVAGDYSIELTGVDALGNEGPTSDPETIAHRPAPPAPKTLAITASVLSWSWSDP